MKTASIFIFVILIIIVGFFLYDSKRGAAPLFPKQIDIGCPYYKDFLGRVYFKSTVSSLFVIFGDHDAWLKVKNISQNNFRFVNGCIATDTQSVIYKGRVYKNADVDTFEDLGGEYYKDKTNVYYVATIINGADPSSFMLLSSPAGCSNRVPSYAKDKNFVYYAGGAVQGADLVSFELYCDNDQMRFRDKNRTYPN